MTLPPEKRWVVAQAASGAVFAAFVLIHLSNQMTAIGGPTTYDATQAVLRRWYQSPLVEVVLVLTPLALHVGISLRRMRLKGSPPPWPMRLHRWSGRFLAVVIIGHAGATRGASLLYGVFPGFDGVAFTFAWQPLYFVPYYTLLALGGWYHLLHGLSVSLAVLGVSWAAKLRRPPVLATAWALGGVLLLGGLITQATTSRDVMQSPYAKLVLRLAGG